MAETKVEAIDQVNQLKASLESKHKALPRQERGSTSQESLISYQVSGRFSTSSLTMGIQSVMETDRCLVFLHRWSASVCHG